MTADLEMFFLVKMLPNILSTELHKKSFVDIFKHGTNHILAFSTNEISTNKYNLDSESPSIPEISSALILVKYVY